MIRYQIVTDPTDAQAIATFLDQGLGDGLHDPEWIAEQITSAKEFVVEAVEVGLFRCDRIGVGTACVFTEDDESPNLTKELRTNDIEVTFPLGYLESVVLLPAYRGIGLGKRLAEARVRLLKDNGCQLVAAHSWLSGAAHTSKPVLEAIGFKEVAILLNHWAGTHCPKCGQGCRCSAALMVLR